MEGIKHRPPDLPALPRFAALVLAYLASAWIGLQYAVVGSTVTLIWAPSGIALAALLAWGPGMAAGVLVAAFAANAATGLAWPASALVALGNALSALLGAWLLRRLAPYPKPFDALRDVLALILQAGPLAATVSATLGLLALLLAGTVELAGAGAAWLKWWLGDLMGMLVVTPLLLNLGTRTPAPLPPRRSAEGLLLLTLLGLLGWFLFCTAEPAARGHYLSSLAVFPFVIWGAMRFGPAGASLVTLLLALLAVLGTARGHGPFAGPDPADGLLRWCAFGIVTAVTGLLLAAAMAERRRARRELHDSHAELERRVEERTRALAAASVALQREVRETLRLEAALMRASEAQQQALGQELHDGLGQLLTSLALMGAGLQQRLAQQAPAEAEGLQRMVELIHQSSALTRSIARGLYPVALELGGLGVALEQLAGHAREHLGRACELRIDPALQQPLRPPQAALHLYRVAQEAMSNALKHSGATRLRIELERRDGRVRLSIADNGRGIAPQQLQPGGDGTGGIGLASMRYRVGLLGGRLDISSTPGQGSTISASYPEPEPSPHDEQPDPGFARPEPA